MRTGSKILTFLILIIVAWLVYSAAFSYWNTLPYNSYKTGQEIVGFPIEAIAMTVGGYSTVPDVTFPKTSTDILVNITLQNLTNNTLYFSQSDQNQASSKHLYLTYQTKNGHGEAAAWNYTDRWGIRVSETIGLNSLAPNQSLNGYIRYVLGNANYTTYGLICRSGSEQKPLFIVSLP